MSKVIKKTKAVTKKTAKPAAKPTRVAAKKAAPKKAAKPSSKKVATKKPAANIKAKPTTNKVTVKKVILKAKPKVKAKPVKKPILKAKVIAKKSIAKPTHKTVVKKIAKAKTAKKVKAIKKPVKIKTTPKPPKALAKKVVIPKAVRPIPEKNNAKQEQKPFVKIIQKTPTEKAHQVAVLRHFTEAKPLMDVSVVRYKDADLAIFKEVILKKIAKAKEEIDFYSDQIKNSSESETQFASIDDGSMTSERENMNQIVVRMQKLISHLESALVRIENKSYGICRETGKLIPKERLLVVPHATLSVEGKKMEKK